MLIKYSAQAGKKIKSLSNGKEPRSTGSSKMVISTNIHPRIYRKMLKTNSSKRTGVQNRYSLGREEVSDPCDNSNDSGLGFDHSLELTSRSVVKFSEPEELLEDYHPFLKRKKLAVQMGEDSLDESFQFSSHLALRKADIEKKTPTGFLGLEHLPITLPTPISEGTLPMNRVQPRRKTNSNVGVGGLSSRRVQALTTQLSSHSRDGRAHLQILTQPEQQHRARYQTEGSRGAVKDRSGNGFPVVKLAGYNKPATLQVFIGTDLGRVAPHMFYQACRVSGKNSTPCLEKKIDGTIVIEVEFEPEKDMVVTCDCVGILKERNVDVEHRFPDQSATRSKKKSTRCRMVFRTTVTNDDGSTETLQTISQPIVCTQPPGIPEICKKSLTTSACTGGTELFILGKNFLKDTRVVFKQMDSDPVWEEHVQPDKEYLQQTHLVCVVPPFHNQNIREPVTVRLSVTSSGKTSEPHNFVYTPVQPTVGGESPDRCVKMLPPGVSQPAVEINQQFTKSGFVPLMLNSASGVKSVAIVSTMKSPEVVVETTTSTPCGVKKEPLMVWSTQGLKTVLVDGRQEVEPCVKAVPSSLLPAEKTLKVVSETSQPQAMPVLTNGDIKVEMNVCSTESRSSPEMSPNTTAFHDASTTMTVAEEAHKNGSLQLQESANLGIALAHCEHTPNLQVSPHMTENTPVTSVPAVGTLADLSGTNPPSAACMEATLRQLVQENTCSPLPAQSAQSVEKFLSRLENTPCTTASNHHAPPPLVIYSRKTGMPTLSTQLLNENGLAVISSCAPVISESSAEMNNQPLLIASQRAPLKTIVPVSDTISEVSLSSLNSHKQLPDPQCNLVTKSSVNSQSIMNKQQGPMVLTEVPQPPLIPVPNIQTNFQPCPSKNMQLCSETHVPMSIVESRPVADSNAESLSLMNTQPSLIITQSHAIFAQQAKTPEAIPQQFACMPTSLISVTTLPNSDITKTEPTVPATSLPAESVAAVTSVISSQSAGPLIDSSTVTSSALNEQPLHSYASTLTTVAGEQGTIVVSDGKDARCPSVPDSVKETNLHETAPHPTDCTNFVNPSSASSAGLSGDEMKTDAALKDSARKRAIARAVDQALVEIVSTGELGSPSLLDQNLPRLPGFSAGKLKRSLETKKLVLQQFVEDAKVKQQFAETAKVQHQLAQENQVKATMVMQTANEGTTKKTTSAQGCPKKTEDSLVPQEFAQMSEMSENDLLTFINPSCFDQV